MTDRLRYLYASVLAPDQPISVVSAIFDRARRHNVERALSGVLLFDGERFAQLLEGDAGQVQPLVDRILKDPRHFGVEPLLSLLAPPDPPLRANWRAGYAPPGSLEALTWHSDPLMRLLRLLPSCDLD